MSNVILFDNERSKRLLPLTYTRPVCELRVGIFTIRQKWEMWLDAKCSYITREFLSEKYQINIANDNYVINGSALPNPQLVRLIQQLEMNEALMKGEELIAVRLDNAQFDRLMEEGDMQELVGYQLTETPVVQLSQVTDVFRLNAAQIKVDFEKFTHLRKSAKIPDHVVTINSSQIFIEESAQILPGTILNASEGPIYIGKNTKVMEACLIKGPFAMDENAVLKMGAKIYPGTTLGVYCKVGGEVNNCVFQGYSNKGHDGFLGNSVIGEWCNLGADTNTSNLKNNYDEVKLWSYQNEGFKKTGLQFCGLIMGDHSKCGINTMFNTGTVVGVHCNIFGEGYPRNFVPSFCWGGKQGLSTYKFEKAMATANRMMERRGQALTDEDQKIYQHIFTKTTTYRPWESPDGKDS